MSVACNLGSVHHQHDRHGEVDPKRVDVAETEEGYQGEDVARRDARTTVTPPERARPGGPTLAAIRDAGYKQVLFLVH